jgi:transcription-repair coupling factor (superfamily II helicase)
MNKTEQINIKLLMDLIAKKDRQVNCSGLSGSEKAYLVSRIYNTYNRPVVVIVPSRKHGERFIEDLQFFIKSEEIPILFFPPYNLLPYKDISYHNETSADRIRTLYSLITCDMPPLVITTAGAVMKKIIPKEKMCSYAELIAEGEDIDRDLLIEKLVSGGYERSVIVEEPGDYCVRGGILDIFSPFYPDPFRIELFGDTVDSLRFFSAFNQRQLKSISEAVIIPAKEAIVQKEDMETLISSVFKQASKLDIPVARSRELLDRIKNNESFTGIESILSLIYRKLDTFFDYVPENALFVLEEENELDKDAKDLWELASENFKTARDEKKLCVEPETLFLKWQIVKDVLVSKKPLCLRMLSIANDLIPDDQNSLSAYSVDVKIQNNTEIRNLLQYHTNQEKLLLPLSEWINDKNQAGFCTIITCSTKAQADRLTKLLLPYSITPYLMEHFNDIRHNNRKDTVYICIGHVFSGFVWRDESLAIITEDEIFVAKHRRRKQKQNIQTRLLEVIDLKREDLVVHTEHGIGRYEGLAKLSINGATNDFLLIVYKDGDKLYLPVDRMNMISKYMGVEGILPVLDKMGGKSWLLVKKKIKKSVVKIAGKLLELYAERKVKKGYAFVNDDSLFTDFEADFPYEETKDQLDAINDVLNDMEQPTAMDRLVCGDVGYGKTEVALRAAFKTVSCGKQVAVLVPTTVLAEQHFETFTERFKPYPVVVECLSRFRSDRKQRDIIENLKLGKIDIVIGTHRLIQKDVGFKDLGLFVLDEEQRFGVRHKEKLKSLRSTVDVLALTATPIPRTLQLSMVGVRDISVISTPPEHRHGIITYICKFDNALVSEAIRKELKRNGQIFFIHNNINTIDAIAEKLKRLVPEVRLDIAHGRQHEKDLEKVMFRFINREIDMLVCTTIVESGIDIPSANTILVNRADRFGLSQMYQLRGRVGRSDEQAYAYLFIPDDSVMTKAAQKRLKVLMEHSDLGSGFQIAMNDLKIRGGGTILGVSQSGHIAAVGYDMFLKLMEKTVLEMKGEPVIEELDPEINVAMSSYLPEAYISDIDQRLSMYRRLAKIKDISDVIDVKNEMTDRFGALPAEASNLLLKIMLKVLSIKAGIKRLDLLGTKLTLGFSVPHMKHPGGIIDMMNSKNKTFALGAGDILYVTLRKDIPESLIAQTKNVLKEITKHVNN